MFTIIPAIDLLQGKVVRLTKGDYQKVDHYPFEPDKLAAEFEKNGAQRIHIVDLDGAKEGQLINLEAIKKIRQAVSCKIELGGGIRTKETVKTLFSLGLDYLVLGSLLLKNPDLSIKIIQDFPNKIIAGIDTKNDFVAVEGWLQTTKTPMAGLINQLNAYPVESIIYTDIQKDGTLEGPNIAGLQKAAQCSNIPIIASGGVSNIADIRNIKELETLGVKGCIVGKALLSGKIKLKEIFS